MDYLDRVLVPLLRVHSSTELLRKALGVQSRNRFALYDSLIVAAALEAKCSKLYTEDLRHGQIIDELRVENPFLNS